MGGTGAEFFRELFGELINHVFYTFVRDDDSGLSIQPALGVTFASVNAVRSAILSPHPNNVSPVSGYVFLNDLLSPETGRPGGWLYASRSSLRSGLKSLLDTLDRVVADTRFFESLNTVDDYVRAVQASRWKFFTIMPTYLYALLVIGEERTAANLARALRAQVVNDSQERGLALRPTDTLPYDGVIRNVEKVQAQRDQ